MSVLNDSFIASNHDYAGPFSVICGVVLQCKNNV